MTDAQITTSGSVDFGNSSTLSWNWGGDSSRVPQGMLLVISTLTFNFFPVGTGTIGRADIAGRDSGGDSVWRLGVVYVEPRKTIHLPFPDGLRLESGGRVELAFTSEGPGTITVDVNAILKSL